MAIARVTRMTATGPPLGNEPAAIRQRIELLEKLLERAFVIPGTNHTIGLDAIVGLVPVAGDTVAALLGLYIVWEARNLGMSKWQLARMTATVGFDWLLGLVPVAGDLLDYFYKSNSINLRRIRRHLDRHHPATGIVEQ